MKCQTLFSISLVCIKQLRLTTILLHYIAFHRGVRIQKASISLSYLAVQSQRVLPITHSSLCHLIHQWNINHTHLFINTTVLQRHCAPSSLLCRNCTWQGSYIKMISCAEEATFYIIAWVWWWVTHFYTHSWASLSTWYQCAGRVFFVFFFPHPDM